MLSQKLRKEQTPRYAHLPMRDVCCGSNTMQSRYIRELAVKQYHGNHPCAIIIWVRRQQCIDKIFVLHDLKGDIGLRDHEGRQIYQCTAGILPRHVICEESNDPKVKLPMQDCTLFVITLIVVTFGVYMPHTS